MTISTSVNQLIPSFNCNKCFKTFTAKHNLNLHSRTVHKELERCSLCHSLVKNLVQHNTRHHADISKGRKQCQYCLKWYIRICAHKCFRQSYKNSFVPIACAPSRVTEDFEPVQVSSLTVSKNHLPRAPVISPQYPSSRSVSLLSLNNTSSTHQGSSFELPSNDTRSTSHWAHLDFLINMNLPLDPTTGSPELLSTYPDDIDDTISISPHLIPHRKGFKSVSSLQGISNIDLPDHDIPMPSIESCDADHSSAEEPTMTESGFDWMTWEEYTSSNFNALEQWL